MSGLFLAAVYNRIVNNLFDKKSTRKAFIFTFIWTEKSIKIEKYSAIE